MYKIKETVIVEGVYDKIRLSGFLDGIILTTGGFGIFTDKNKQETIKNLAKKTGIVIFTDADTAGFKIRNFVKQLADPDMVKHAYIPDIEGKEKRKRIPGKEGLLGVEGVKNEILLKALTDAGCEIDGMVSTNNDSRKITKTDFYFLGLSGCEGGDKRREILASSLGVSTKISANMLLDVVNRLMTYEMFEKKCDELFGEN